MNISGVGGAGGMCVKVGHREEPMKTAEGETAHPTHWGGGGKG